MPDSEKRQSDRIDRSAVCASNLATASSQLGAELAEAHTCSKRDSRAQKAGFAVKTKGPRMLGEAIQANFLA